MLFRDLGTYCKKISPFNRIMTTSCKVLCFAGSFILSVFGFYHQQKQRRTHYEFFWKQEGNNDNIIQ